MFLHESLSNQIVPALHRVHKALGPGLLENVYEKALAIEFTHLNIPFSQQQKFEVIYRNTSAGTYFADMVVDGTIILELKSVTLLNAVMEAQLLNYLSISGLRVGYLINFRNPVLEKKRLVI